MLRKVISGGQRGVDRAALDVAIALGLEHGGWCPKGRRAEDGTIPMRYHLRQTESSGYVQRTRLNIFHANHTLVLSCGVPTGGTLRTMQICQGENCPYTHVDLQEVRTGTFTFVRGRLYGVEVLNVAGPRASKCPEAYHLASSFLEILFQGLMRKEVPVVR